jgi:SAM-dependent methyltransferase
LPQGIPLPPVQLGARVGATHADNLALYEEFGAETKEEILAILPEAWLFAGKTVLDFGCGAGRTLRHFLDEAQIARVLGCDIHAESVAWLAECLCPPLEVFVNDEVPPLPLEDGSVDLVWAISVFTHLTDQAHAWLVELHRILSDEGLLIATFHGPGAIETIAGERWDADRIGMTVLRHGESWDAGGPMVFHSPWWIREHWGRAFEVVTLREEGFATRTTRDQKPVSWRGQGVVLLRRKDVRPTAEVVRRTDPGDARELDALRFNLELVQREAHHARMERTRLLAELAEARNAPRVTPARGIRARLSARAHRGRDASIGG